MTQVTSYNKSRHNWYITSGFDWTGAIAIPSIVDVGYATSSSDKCINENMDEWPLTDCGLNNWLGNLDHPGWLLSFHMDSYQSYAVCPYYSSRGGVHFAMGSDGVVGHSYIIYPTLYLKSTVKIKSGTGTSTDPFILTE